MAKQDQNVIPASQESDDVQIGQHVTAQIPLEEGELSKIVDWAYSEIIKAKSDRQELDSRLAEWEVAYEALPEQEVKTEPWEGAANLVVSTIATAVEAVLARVVNAVFGGKELWLGTARSGAWTDAVEPITVWLNWVGKEIINMYRICQRWFLTTIKFGTGVMKLSWEKKLRKVMYMEGENSVHNEIITIHDGPIGEVIPLADFFFSPDLMVTKDIQTCEWVAHKAQPSFKSLKEKEISGYYQNVDKIKDYPKSESTEKETGEQEATGVQPSEFNYPEIYELWGSYDVDGDGIPEEIVLTFHLESKTVLRAVYNFYRHQERPFHSLIYMPRDHSFLGIGICQMLYDIQEEITTIHNQRLDNATIANMKVFKRLATSRVNIEDVYPGAMIDVDSMEDIEEFDLGDEHSTLLPEELHTNSIGEKRTGVSDYTVGRESAAIGSKATATSTLALIREGNKRFQMFIRDVRETITDVGNQIVQLYQQFAPNRTVEYEMFDEKEKALMQTFFQLPNENVNKNMVLDVPALSETTNKEVSQQVLLTLAGVVERFYAGLFQAFQIALSPGAPEPMKGLAVQAAQAVSKIWERILEAFDFRDADSFVPNVEMLLGIQASGEMLYGTGQGPGAIAGVGAQAGGPPVGPNGSGAEALAGLLGGQAGRLGGAEALPTGGGA